MSQRCLIHSATRIVLHITIDDSLIASAGTEYVEPLAPVDIANGPWVLTLGGTLRPPTAQEDADYRADVATRQEAAAPQEVRDLVASLAVARDDVTNTPSARAVFRDMRLELRRRFQGGS